MNHEPFNLASEAKHYCQNVMLVTANDGFFMVMDTGNTKIAYALTPEHMKRLGKSIAYNVDEFEMKFRKIDANWSPGIESPIQSTDLKDGREKRKKK